ncbi:hypothetical protein ACFQ4C_05615 [Larkinella insperata]|uniref:Uncharacterized protein n=1 Tax=Larkinella insperata TaxID=332158 RepID=A0ABW3Q633_9BACT|nr:hypothetical protein [Larkinella insperata]
MTPFDLEKNSTALRTFQQNCSRLRTRIEALQARNERLSERLQRLMEQKQIGIDKVKQLLD